jgi:hypothetical protein
MRRAACAAQRARHAAWAVALLLLALPLSAQDFGGESTHAADYYAGFGADTVLPSDEAALGAHRGRGEALLASLDDAAAAAHPGDDVPISAFDESLLMQGAQLETVR